MSCYSSRYVFIHIPKNAGTSIRQRLNGTDFDSLRIQRKMERDPAYANHYPIWFIEEKFGLPDLPSFMVVRNPWARMVSLYNHRMKKLDMNFEGRPRHTEEDKRVAREGFKPWLLGTPSAGDSILTRTAQANWGKDVDGHYVIHHVLRFEELADDWADICRTLQIPYRPLPHVLKGEKENYRDRYDDESMAHVEKHFAEDIERYGYAF